ncbi:Adenylate and Guanylate cyclase catalytic domain [Trypanosoma vivax]|uniref:adenylate cyclase n=1 Tax=Trypanosoma vivax (strain Y486) TaxID=1055687 RepID=G0U4Z9_TRYVY|nr:Adenylate and Guanylate cyclase catalytic domain [Trypanosoma vivax]CCC52514.1 receptor-type adenylate cyclase, GRESAG [Trypanosoma vivax Y486]
MVGGSLSTMYCRSGRQESPFNAVVNYVNHGRVCTKRCSLVTGLPLLLITCLVSTLTAASNDSLQENVTVNIVSILQTKIKGKPNVDAITAGFNASLWSERKVSGRIFFEFHNPTYDETANTTHVQKIFENKTSRGGKNQLLVALGPFGSQHINMFEPVLKKYNVVGFGPISTGTAEYSWDSSFYFFSVSPTAELIALIRYAVAYLRAQRVGFMYLKGFLYGEAECKLAGKELSHMGYTLSGVFDMPSKDGENAADDVFKNAWEKFAEQLPQATLMFGYPCPDTVRFLMMFQSDNRTSSTYLLAPSTLGYVIDLGFRKILEEKNLFFAPGKLLFTGWNPLAKDGSFKAIQHFKRDMHKYLSQNGTQYNNDTDYFLKHDTEGELMVHGWIIGEILKQSLNSSEWVRDQHTFRESLYNQRRYVVDDLVFGDFGGECGRKAVTNGAICHCNQGGKMVYMKRVMENRRIEPLKEGLLRLGMTTCFSDGLMLPAPLIGVFFDMVDNTLLQKVSREMFKGASILNGDGRLGQRDRLFMHSISATMENAGETLRNEVSTRVVSAVFGVVNDAVLNIPNMTFIDPTLLAPRLADPRRNVIHLTPTLEQQFFVLASYLSGLSIDGLHTVIRSSEGAAIAEKLYNTLWTVKVTSLSSVLLNSTEPMGNHLQNKGNVLVIGLNVDDIYVLAEHLHTYNDTRVFVCFSDLALFYNEFVSAFKGKTVGDRLLFATNLPHWNDPNPATETGRKFNENVRKMNVSRTPLTMMGFVTGRLMQEILPLMPTVNAEALAQFFYTNVGATADDMHYGPFSDSKCGPSPNSIKTGCAVNYGATSISVWSMARVLDPSVKEVSGPISIAVVYSEDLYLGLSLPVFVPLVVFFIMLLLLGLLALIHFLRRDARDNRNAPKVPTAPVTLVFTDIESSTSQWAANPQLMPGAVATHHRLIRALIAQHRCYEVKTIGDSFMIACKSALAAVRLVHDLQHKFLEHNWGTTVFDESYRTFEEQRAEEDAEYVPPTARLEPEVYRRLWNGLRVRAGVHTGLCDIRHDEVTKGYDYYGRTSNMAARTESVAHGGQVLLTRAAYMALTASEREQLDVTSLGAVSLRGVPEPVEMYQLNAVPGRTFRPLRLDVEPNDEYDDRHGCLSTTDSSTSSNAMTQTGRIIAISLQTLLSVFPLRQRQKLLQSCCDQWRIRTPKPCKVMWNEEACKEAINRVAATVGKVTGPKSRVDDASTASGSLEFCPTRVLSGDKLLPSPVAKDFSKELRSLSHSGQCSGDL